MNTVELLQAELNRLQAQYNAHVAQHGEHPNDTVHAFLLDQVQATKKALKEAERMEHNQKIYLEMAETRKANGAVIDAERAAQAAAQRVDAEAERKAQALHFYSEVNGSDDGFDAAWPVLRSEMVNRQVLAKLDAKLNGGDLVDKYIARRNAVSEADRVAQAKWEDKYVWKDGDVTFLPKE